MREAKGNMYSFVTHTWNPVKGKCPHDCLYCYMKQFRLKKPRLDEAELMEELGSRKFIFVGSSIDLFAEGIPDRWIEKVLEQACEYRNRYLLQSENVKRMYAMRSFFPADTVVGTTIETNYHVREVMGNAPMPQERARYMARFAGGGYRTMVTIEPIMEFRLDAMVDLIKKAGPEWVNIGADSKGHGLIEPSPGKIYELIRRLQAFTEIKIKDNLKRLTE